MKTKLFLVLIAFFIGIVNCFSQPSDAGRKPPSIEERIKMIDEKICQSLKLDKAQKEKLLSAFNIFFVDLDKIAIPPARPDKSKVDALAKIRDGKVKLAIPESLYTKYLELEMQTRPKGPEAGRP